MLKILSESFRRCIQDIVSSNTAYLPALNTLAHCEVPRYGSSEYEVGFKDSGILWMAVPKRKKSAKMKRIQRNKPWMIPKDMPYTTCTVCGSPRRLYFVCEPCYEKVAEATRKIQEPLDKELQALKMQKKWERLHHNFTPMTHEERLEPYIEKYTEERLKPQPFKPKGTPWKQDIEEYKEWYIEGGAPVLKKETDEDIELLSDGKDPKK